MTIDHEHYTSEYPEPPKKYKCRTCGKTFERAIKGFLCTACIRKGVDQARGIIDKCRDFGVLLPTPRVVVVENVQAQDFVTQAYNDPNRGIIKRCPEFRRLKIEPYSANQQIKLYDIPAVMNRNHNGKEILSDAETSRAYVGGLMAWSPGDHPHDTLMARVCAHHGIEILREKYKNMYTSGVVTDSKSSNGNGSKHYYPVESVRDPGTAAVGGDGVLMGFGEVLQEFKDKETASQILLIEDDPQKQKVLIAWNGIPIKTNGTKEKCPDGQYEKWQWLWMQVEIDLELLASRAFDMNRYDRIFYSLMDNFLVYPDGTINEWCRKYIEQRIAKEVRR